MNIDKIQKIENRIKKLEHSIKIKEHKIWCSITYIEKTKHYRKKRELEQKLEKTKEILKRLK